MAIPLWLPLALTAGSTLANNYAANKVAGAQAAAMERSRLEQKRLDDEAFGINETMRQRYDDFEGQQDQRKTNLADYFTSQVAESVPETAGALPASDSNIVNTREASEMATARDFVRGQGASLAGLRSFGDLLGAISRDQGRSAGDINTLFGFQRGNSTLLPLDLEAASRAGDGAFLLGDILGGFGSVLMFPGLMGGGAAGATRAAAGAAVPRASFANGALPGLY